MEYQVTKQETGLLLYLAAADSADTDAFISNMRQFGYEIERFHRTDALTTAIAEQAPQALILDCDADDGRLAKAIMQAQAANGATVLPVIMISSTNNFAQRLAAVRANVDGYFIKPVDVAALSDRIDDKISRNRIRSYRILAVEDDIELSEFYKAVLNLASMHVKVLNDPTQILEVLSSFQPDLILLDLHMPSCSGAEIAKLIRQNHTYLNIPLVFLSGEDNIDRQVSAIETGADNFLVKPIDPENLISLVTSRVERYRALRQGRYA